MIRDGLSEIMSKANNRRKNFGIDKTSYINQL
uniref:Uncharacterized protein n=1 Tax=Siphoviridae sp. ctXZx16 TaxID=2826371 RepID=A0A8S5MLX6_9CAUD|nr:MAG TPA: hypothetical protein [Siphoviridae sp. ctXZx16]DAO32104.1 MAG TPA: hypothetical protein [Caudoviricetes sp.]